VKQEELQKFQSLVLRPNKEALASLEPQPKTAPAKKKNNKKKQGGA